LAALPTAPERVFIAGRQQHGSNRTQRRLQRYRTGAEGPISHLKRRYGLDRSRLKGDTGQQTGTAWADLAYNLHADRIAPTPRGSRPTGRQARRRNGRATSNRTSKTSRAPHDPAPSGYFRGK
jgi:IS5 family transposase